MQIVSGQEMETIKLILILFLVLAPLPVFTQDDTTGSICVAPVPKPNDRPISLGNPTGGNRSFNFTIQVDQQAGVPVDHEKSIMISGLAIKGTHLVQIFRDGKPFASFRFRFEQYKSKELCLWFKALYETWSLWENTASVGCRCTR